MKPAKHLTFIESLEARIAPALIINPYTVTYQDENGDTAVIKISKPLFTSATAAGNILKFADASNSTYIQESFTGNGTSEFLNTVNLLGRTDASGMNISVTVLPQVGVGNLTVGVGSIQAATINTGTLQVTQNIDLGAINIQGNLGSINAGATDYYFIPSVKSITVESMTTDAQSYVLGPIGSLNVQHDFTANLTVAGYQFGNIGKLSIGGNLTGDAAGDANTGQITWTGTLGSAVIGNIVGGAANNTGELIGSTTNPSHLGSLTVTGSIQGGAGQYSGVVFANSSIGSINVASDVAGSSGADSAYIIGPIGTVKIGGSLKGGSGSNSGEIFSQIYSTGAATAIGSVTIGGDIRGGPAGSTGTPGNSGIISATTARSITVGGSLIGGGDTNTAGDGDTSGVIMVNSVQNLVIVGNVTGGSGANSGLITSQGNSSLTSYGNIFISGDVTGGSGALSGAIDLTASDQFTLAGGFVAGSANLSNLHIGGSVIGSSGGNSGYINVSAPTGNVAKLSTLSIGGNVVGGTATSTGEIFTTGTLGKGVINGNITGGTLDTTTALADVGYLEAKTITSLEVKGSITAGTNTGAGGSVADSGAIRAAQNIVSLTIDGAVTGTDTNPVIISAAKGPGTTAKTDLAIAGLTFQKNVSYLDVLAGYSPPNTGTYVTAPLGNTVDSTAQIGTVTFAGNLAATNVVAGVVGVSKTGYPPYGQFGTAADKAIPFTTGGTSGLHSSIAQIIIAGTATGDSTSGDSFGFVAQEVAIVEVGGPPPLDLTPGANNDHLIPVGGNLVVNEVPPA
jgi:hypothetical protein